VPVPSRLFGVGLGLLLTAHLCLLGFRQISDVDTWWHLKQGELFVTTGSLPAQDPFAFTTGGHEWIKYSWAADVLFSLVFKAFGLPGLVLLRLALFLIVSLALYRVFRGCGLHPTAAVLLLVVASMALGFRFMLRPEMLGLFLLIATVVILLRLRDSSPRAAYALLPTQIAWTNVHASFVFGLGLPGLVLLANLLPRGRFAPGWGQLRLDGLHLRHLAIAVACLPLACLVNPQGVSVLLFPFRQNRMTRLTEFIEWKPVWSLVKLDPVWWVVLIVLGLVLLAFAVTAILLAVRERRMDPVGLAIVLSMGTYAAFRNRAVASFVLTILPFLALALVRVAAGLRERAGEGASERLARIGGLACAIVLTASIAVQIASAPRGQYGLGVRRDRFPEAAMAFLERNHLDGRVFNTYMLGGYLIWRRWPSNQAFIDGRYDGILFDEALLEDYLQTYWSPSALDRITSTYAVEILVLSANPNYLLPYIGKHPEWARVYWDPDAEIFVRRGGSHAALIAKGEYSLTRSSSDLSYLVAYRRDPALRARALGELRRAVAENPENGTAWLGLAQEYWAQGPAAAAQRLDALTHVARVEAGTPVVGRVYAEQADALLQLGRLAEAKVAAQQARRLDGQQLLPYWVLALVAEGQGEWREARDRFLELQTRLDPSDERQRLVRSRLDAAERRLRGGPGTPD